MTCIVGLTKNEKIYIGGDSCGSDGFTYSIYKNNDKVFKNKRFLIGCTSSFRFIDILRYNFTPPELKQFQDIDSYMRSDFIDAFRKALDGGGYSKKENGKERGGNCLIGYEGRLFEIQSDFSVLSCPDWGAAIGSGTYVAHGVLYHLHHTKNNKDPEEVLNHALEAAAGVVTTVKGPFKILSAELDKG